MMNWNNAGFPFPRFKGGAIAEATTQAFRYALMTQESSNASNVHQWLVPIFPKKELKFLLMVTIIYLRVQIRGHQGPRRRSRRYQEVPSSFWAVFFLTRTHKITLAARMI